MNKGTESSYLDELWSEMTTELEAFIRSGDQERLHRFRVNVKKIRAFLTLLDFALGHRISKRFKPVKKVFRRAGEIRDAYIHLQLGSQYELRNEEFILRQVNQIDQAVKKFMDKGSKYQQVLSKAHDRVIADLKAASNDRISEFFKDQLAEIAVILRRNQFDDELHECRKKIKTLVYNRKIAGKALDGSLVLNHEYLDRLQQRIGDWHDGDLAIRLFSAPEWKSARVIGSIRRKNAGLRKSIQSLAADFWLQATASGQAGNVDGTPVWA